MSNTKNFDAIKPLHNESPEQVLVARYDGPAVLVDADGTNVCNDAAVAIIPKFQDASVPDTSAHDARTCEISTELLDLVQKVHASGCVETDSLSFSGKTGMSIYQTICIPRVLGKWVLCLLQDQTLEHNLREALIESRQRFKDLVEVSSDFSWEVDAAGYFQFVSRTGALGYAPEALVGQRPEDLVVDADEFDPLPFLSTKTVENIELWMRHSDGGMSCVQVSAIPFF